MRVLRWLMDGETLGAMLLINALLIQPVGFIVVPGYRLPPLTLVIFVPVLLCGGLALWGARHQQKVLQLRTVLVGLSLVAFSGFDCWMTVQRLFFS